MNQFEFSTLGDWDTTTLYNDGVETQAARLYIEIHAGKNDQGEPAAGGIALGGEASAYINSEEDAGRETPVFPGKIELSLPLHTVVVENTHPDFAFEATRVWFDSRDVTNCLIDLLVDVNAADNQVSAYIILYKAHWLSSSEVATYTLIG